MFAVFLSRLMYNFLFKIGIYITAWCLTRRMAIANGTSVSCCNQPKAHFRLPWVRPWVNRSKCHMDEKRIQCLSNALQHVPIYIQPFPSNSTRKFKKLTILARFCTFWPPWVRPWDNCGKCYTDWKRIQCWSNALQHIPVYLQQYTSYSEILVGNCNFSYPLEFNAPFGVVPLEFREKFGPQKTRIMGLPGSENSLTIGWAVSTQYQRVTNRQTDRQTDVQPISITCAVWLTHVKNWQSTKI